MPSLVRRTLLTPFWLAQVLTQEKFFARNPVIGSRWLNEHGLPTPRASAAPMVYVQTVLSHAVEGPADPQRDLHTDTFHPTVKAWLFLTDVTQDAMPFVYVPGPRRLTPHTH